MKTTWKERSIFEKVLIGIGIGFGTWVFWTLFSVIFEQNINDKIYSVENEETYIDELVDSYFDTEGNYIGDVDQVTDTFVEETDQTTKDKLFLLTVIEIIKQTQNDPQLIPEVIQIFREADELSETTLFEHQIYAGAIAQIKGDVEKARFHYDLAGELSGIDI